MVEKFVGKFLLDSSENFDEYMKEVGVNMMTRTVAASLKPSYVITRDGDDVYNIRTESTFKNSDLIFKLNEEFDETTTDGRKVRSIIRLEGSKLIQNQKGRPGAEDKTVPSVITRELTDKDTLVCVCTANDKKSTRVYNRA